MQLEIFKQNITGTTISATGHRPDRLGGYSNQVLNRLTDLAIAYLSRSQPTKVISGMALGWDTAIALASLKLEIPLIAAVPFKGQDRKWSSDDVMRYHQILKESSEIVIVSEGGYSPAKMQIRNVWMVDRCDHLVALWNGSNGGTGNCVKYAQSKGIKTINLWNSWEKYKGF